MKTKIQKIILVWFLTVLGTAAFGQATIHTRTDILKDFTLPLAHLPFRILHVQRI